jgi:hypothetical protein
MPIRITSRFARISAMVVASFVGVAGLIDAATSAQAQPGTPFPLAPACQEWRLEGGVLTMTTSDGSRVKVDWDPGSQRPTSGWMTSGGTTWGDAFITGHVEGTTVSFTVAWREQGGSFDSDEPAGLFGATYTDDFTGKIAPDGQVTGTRLDNARNSTTWLADQRFTCAKQAAEPNPAPKPDKPVRATGKPKTAPQPVTDAIALSFERSNFFTITATITNSSQLPGQCTYDATPPIGDSHRDFAIDPNGIATLTFSGFPSGAMYHAVVVCNDSSGTQKVPIGRTEADTQF